MRLKFRIFLYVGDRRLRKKELLDRKEPLWIGIRYITEFKYLEATKWLLLAEDSYEKYLLLALIHLSLGQAGTAQEFISEGMDKEKGLNLKVIVNEPEKGLSFEIDSFSDLKKITGEIA